MASLRQIKKHVQTPNVDSRMRRMTNFFKTKNSNRTTSKASSGKGGNETQDRTTIVQNNRELASALSKARVRIGDLESERVRLQSDRQKLMEQVTVMATKLQKCKGEDVARKAESARLVKEVSETVDSKLQKTTEKLMESSDLLIDVIKCVSCLSKLADSEIDADNRSTDTTRTPLKIICEDILQTSSEADAALSITNMTPSSSYSENEEVISPTGHDLLTPDNLLIQGTLHNPQDSMDVDTPSIIPEGDLPISSSTPHRGPEIKFSPVVCCLPTTPEACEGGLSVSRTVNDVPMDSPRVSSMDLSPAERRFSKRRNVRANFYGYKEPSLNSKLRQGDPFTDCSMFSPKAIRPRNEQFSLKRKNKQSGNDKLRKKFRKNSGTKRCIELCC